MYIKRVSELMENHGISYWWDDSYRKNQGRKELIKKLLESFGDRTIEEQLSLRGIKCIEIVSRISNPALLFPLVNPLGFAIALRKEEKEEENNWLISIGHELAHTFFYVLDKQYNRYTRGLLAGHPKEYWEEESFCEDFAHEWIKLNERKSLDFIEKIKKAGPGKTIPI